MRGKFFTRMLSLFKKFKQLPCNLHRVFCVVTAAGLIAASPAWAVMIPSEFGRVEENLPGTNGKTIILIQEAHVDYYVQKAIAEILKHLTEEESLRLVMVEGGWGDVSLSFMRRYADLPSRLKIGERYLKEGKISGEEYLDLVSDRDIRLWGIEDPVLYNDNMSVFMKIQVRQEHWLDETAKLRTVLKAIGEKILPPSLRLLEEKREAYERQGLNLIEYLGALAGTSAGKQIIARFPQLRNLLSLAGNAEGFDITKFEPEKAALVRMLARELSRLEAEVIHQGAKVKTIDEEAYYLAALLDLVERHPKVRQAVPVPNLRAYAAALTNVSQSGLGDMTVQLDRFESAVMEKLAGTDEQKKWIEISRGVSRMEKLFRMTLTAEEFEKLNTPGQSPDPAAWREFLQGHSALAQKNVPWPDFEYLANGLPDAKQFYLLAQERESALIENALRKIEEEQTGLAAMIIGGFHQANLKTALNAKGFTVISVLPRVQAVNTAGHQRQYLRVLKYKWNNPALNMQSKTQFNFQQGAPK